MKQTITKKIIQLGFDLIVISLVKIISTHQDLNTRYQNNTAFYFEIFHTLCQYKPPFIANIEELH